MSERRILFLSQLLPWPLDSGAKVRAYYVLRQLAERHRVTLVALVRPEDPPSATEHLAQFCDAIRTVPIYRSFLQDAASVLWGLLSDQPALIVRERQPECRALIRRLLAERQFDAVHVDQIKTACHLEGATDLPPRLIDKHNVYCDMVGAMADLETRALRARLLRREARAMRRYEAQVCREFEQIVSVTQRDAERLSEMANGATPVTTIPICVDPGVVHPIEGPAKPNELLFCGAMMYPPNVDAVLWLCNEVMPRVWRANPEVRLRLVGARATKAVRRAAAADERILLDGYVRDLEPAYRSAAACLVPLRAGSGMRVKILDAMARRVPVVSTSLGAEGIDVQNESGILIADKADEFAAAVVRLVGDGDLRQAIADNGRRVVERRYDWRRRYVEFDPVYERLFVAGEARK